MQENSRTAYSRILAAAVESLEELGPAKATTRVIAEKADVNIASINYYFRSKENLMRLAAENVLNRTFDWDVLDDPDDMDTKDRLVYGLNMLVEGCLNYGDFTDSVSLSGIMHSELNVLVLERVKAFMRHIVDEFCGNGDMGRATVEMSVSQVFSAVLLPGMLMPGIYEEFEGIDLTDLKNRLEYIRNAVEKLL